MDYFWGSVKLALVVWGLGAFISFLVAWVIKLIFSAIRLKQARAARAAAMPAAAETPADAAVPRAERSA